VKWLQRLFLSPWKLVDDLESPLFSFRDASKCEKEV
jgi:hypothetical protein